MTSILEELTYSNYEQLASQVAKEFFPVGSLVSGCGYGFNFGIVTSISKTGKITVQRGKLPVEKVTDNEGTGGTYAKIWYRGNINEFVIPTEDELMRSAESSKTRFSPRCYIGKDWKERGYASPVEWTNIQDNRMRILSKPKINEKGLIMKESYSD